MFELDLTKQADKQLRCLDSSHKKRVVHRFTNLLIDPLPLGVKQLHSKLKVYRIRVGNYRILYRILHQQKIIRIYRIEHRSKVYKNL